MIAVYDGRLMGVTVKRCKSGRSNAGGIILQATFLCRCPYILGHYELFGCIVVCSAESLCLALACRVE